MQKQRLMRNLRKTVGTEELKEGKVEDMMLIQKEKRRAHTVGMVVL